MKSKNSNPSRRQFLKRSSYFSIGSTLSINSLGAFSALTSTSVQASDGDFKALVYIFLAGGNDSFNMIAPKGDSQLRTKYEEGRRAVAIPASDLHALTLTNNARIYGGEQFNDFGFHPACNHMAQMFNNQEMSVICNVGNLITPTSREQYFAKDVALPPQLFSHSDQQRQYQSSPTSPFLFGWGGRMAELVSTYNANSAVSSLISVSGLNSFQVSRDSLINPYVMSNDGATPLANFNGVRKNIMESSIASIDDDAHLMVKKYRDVFSSARNAQTIVSSAFAQADATGVDYDAIFTAAGATNTKIARRLKTVAKMIAGRDSTENNRPIYFVEMAGFDTHQKLLTDHNDLMSELNAALKGFRDVLVAQGDFDKVLSYVGSEFGRTLTPNGDDLDTGTDHAWGGHALVMGGMIKGAKFFGTHPDLALKQGLDASKGRGRWIPTTATTQCASVIAHWFGVEKENLAELFPSVENFPSAFEADANLDFIKPEVNV